MSFPFCLMAEQKGFKNYVDCGVHLGHIRETPTGVDDWIKWENR